MARSPQDRTSRLQEKCRALLQSRRHDQSLTRIAKELELSHTFLSDLANGKSHTANAAYLERIYKYFTGKELSL